MSCVCKICMLYVFEYRNCGSCALLAHANRKIKKETMPSRKRVVWSKEPSDHVLWSPKLLLPAY